MAKLYFVLKADPQIGTGHLMRCLNLANMLTNCVITFVTLRTSDNIHNLINPYQHIEVNEFDEIPILLKEELEDSFVMVDCYSLDANFESKCRDICKGVMVIDDLADRTHNCDLLIDGNIDSTTQKYLSIVPENCILLMGQKYSLIRSSFSSLRKTSLPNKFSNGFICFGGADPAHATLISVKTILQSPKLSSLTYTIVTGTLNPDYDEIQTLLQSSNIKYTLLRHTTEIPQMLYSHDFSIGAAGGMCYERICVGIPTIVVSIADNQEGFKFTSERYNLGEMLLLKDLSDVNKLTNAFLRLESNGTTHMQNCQKLIDGQGLTRLSIEIDNFIKSKA